jgi:hypothetical protein
MLLRMLAFSVGLSGVLLVFSGKVFGWHSVIVVFLNSLGGSISESAFLAVVSFFYQN